MKVTPEFCYRLNPSGKNTRLDIKNVSFADKSHPLLWIHLDYQNPKNRSWIQKLSLNAAIIENLLDEDTNPRLSVYQNGIMMVVRCVNSNPAADIDDMIAVHIWLEKERLITLSHRMASPIQAVFNDLRKKHAPKTPVDCFISMAKYMTEDIATAVSQIEEAADALEEDIIVSTADDKELRLKLSEIRHSTVGLRRYVAPERNAFQALRTANTPLFSENHQIQLREMTLDLTKSVEDLDSAREHSTFTQEELDSKTNLSISRTMYIMSIIMMIFTPLTFLTGLLGANIGGIPFSANPYGFWFVSFILGLIVLLQLWLIKRQRWF